MTNPEIADAFDSVADILEFQGANPFRVRAYRNAARTIRDLPESMAEIVADSSRKLTDIEGIGKDLAEKIAALVTTGKLEMLEELKAAGAGIGAGDDARAGPGAETGRHALQGTQGHLARRIAGGLRGPQGPRTQGLRGQDRRVDSGRPAIRRRGRQAGPLGRGRRTRAGDPGPHARLPGRRADRGGGQLSPRPRDRGRPGLPGRRQRRRGRDGPHRRLSGPGRGAVPRRDEAHRAVAERPARRSPRRAGRVVRRGDAVLHRLEGPQRRRPRPGQGPRPEGQRIRRLPRRQADRRPHGGGSLRRARSALLSARECARPAASSSGPPKASFPA